VAVTFDKGQPFEIREEPTGASSLTMRLSGEFDLACRERFEDELARVGRDGIRQLVIDLGGLAFIDSSGIRLLLEAKRSADQDGLDLVVTLPQNGQVRKVLELTGIADLFSPEGKFPP
jgi:anti-sigma B factor antagonist